MKLFRQRSYFYKKGNYYYLYYNTKESKWKNVSTGCSKKLAAEKWAIKFLNSIDKDKNAAITELVSVDMLRNSVIEFNNINLSKNTNDIYKRVFSNFSKIVKKKYLNEIEEKDFERYKSIRCNEVTKTTVNIEIRTLKTIFKYALKNSLINHNPTTDLRQFSIPEKQKTIFSKEDLEILLNQMNSLFRNITLVLFYTGCRLNEVLNLEFKNIDLKNRTIEIVNKPDFKTKTGKIRLIPINSELDKILHNLLNMYKEEKSNGYIFASPRGRPLNKSYVSRKFKNYLKIANLPEDLHLHCIRHTFITELIRNNVEVFKVMKVAGHSTLKTTLGYTHLQIEDLRNDMEQLNLVHSYSTRF